VSSPFESRLHHAGLVPQLESQVMRRPPDALAFFNTRRVRRPESRSGS
jgi:hypothetical protein